MVNNVNSISITSENRDAIVAKLKAAGVNETRINSILSDSMISLEEVSDIGGLDWNSLNVTGTEVERQSSDGKSVQNKSSIEFTVGEGGLTQQEADYLVNTAKIMTKNQNGTYTLFAGKSPNDVQNALKAYNKTLPHTFNLPDDLYNKLTDAQKSLLNKTSQEGQYSCSAENASTIHEALINLDGCTAEEPVVDNSVERPGIDYSKIETTTTEYEDYLSENDIKNANLDERAGRKEFKGKVSESLKNWIENNPDTYGYSATQLLHGKKVDKTAKKLAQEYPTAGRALRYYAGMDNTPDEIKQEISSRVQSAKQDVEGLYDMYKTGKQRYITFEEFAAREDLQNVYAYEQACKGEPPLDRDEILKMCAAQDVMAERSKNPRKAAKDQRKFIDKMADREVQMYRDQQEFDNTVSCWDKDNAKAGNKSNDGKKYRDIGKWGRQLVMGSPSTFCNEITDNGPFDFEANGKKYKFDSDKYKNYFLEESFSGYDEGIYQDEYAKEGRLTLNEGRYNMTHSSGLEEDKTAEDILHTGKGANGKVNNRELNRYRDAAKAAGIHVDRNGTALKRGLYVAAGAGIGATTAAATALGGWALSSLAAVGGTVAGGVMKVEGQDYHGTVKTTDYVTENGFTDSYTHETPYHGRTPDRNIMTPNRNYSDRARQDGFEIARNAAPIGAGLGALAALFSMKNKNAKGTRWDHVIDLQQPVKPTKVEVQQTESAITRENPKVQTYNYTKTDAVENEKLVRYRGLEAYSVLYPNVNKNDFINAYIEAFNEKFGTDLKRGQMPDKFYAIPIVIGGNTINPDENWKNIYKTIQVGTPGQNHRIVNGKNGTIQTAQASRVFY